MRAAPSAAECEERLAPATAWMREAHSVLPGLAGADLDAALAALEHDFLDMRGERMHLELHRAHGAARGCVVFVHGLGDHVRRATALGGGLAAAGFDAVLVDRRGHGLSEGRRGDASLEDDLRLIEHALRYGRERFGSPVALMGDSLGGIMSWYALTREVDADAVVCHCIGHPEERHDPSVRWKAPVLRALGRLTPGLRVPVEAIADYSQVALEPLTQRYFDDRFDPLFNFTITVRAVASYTRFEPPIPWERVELPVLVTIGAEDRMVSRAFTERCLARAKPPRTTYLAHEGLGHQLYLDHLADALPPVVEWLDRELPPR